MDREVLVNRPSIWQAQLMAEETVEFGYLPGGANFTGSRIEWMFIGRSYHYH